MHHVIRDRHLISEVQEIKCLSRIKVSLRGNGINWLAAFLRSRGLNALKVSGVALPLR